MTSNPLNLSPTAVADTHSAVAPLILAGALDAPTVTPEGSKDALTKLGIPTSGKALVVIAYNGCTNHDFITMEKAAKENGAKLYVVYGFPDDPMTLEALKESKKYPENKEKKLSILVARETRPLDATVILERKGSNILTRKEIETLAAQLGLTLNTSGAGISSNGSALFINGAFNGIIADKETSVRAPSKITSYPIKRSTFTLA